MIRSDCDIEVLLERIADIISEYHQIYDDMIRRITDNKGLTEIINAMTSILGNLLYVADADFKVLARTDCDLKESDEWRHIIENGIDDHIAVIGSLDPAKLRLTLNDCAG